MHVILEDCHNFVFIEVGNPVEESVEISGGVSVEGLAGGIDGHVVVGKFDFMFILFESTYHELFLISTFQQNYPSNECM